MKSARPQFVANLMRKDNFRGDSLYDAMAAHVKSPSLAMYTKGINSSYHAEVYRDGVVRLTYTSELKELQQPMAIKHKYSFPLLNDVREIAFVLTPEKPTATSDILVAFRDNVKDYFNIAVHDSDNYMLSCDVLTYNKNGEIARYAALIPSKFESPLHLGEASFAEVRDSSGKRVLRLSLQLLDLKEPVVVKAGYNTAGIQIKQDFTVEPGNPVLVWDLDLDGNHMLVPGDWVLGVTDAASRMLVNAVFYLEAQH